MSTVTGIVKDTTSSADITTAPRNHGILNSALRIRGGDMTREEAKSCIGTIEMLQRLAYNIHGVMDVIDADNCKKIIKALEQEPTTKNDLVVDCISKQAVLNKILKFSVTDGRSVSVTGLWTEVNGLPSVTPQEPIEKCKWIKYDYRTMCPKGHDIDNPYWRIPQNRMETLKYCPYCGKEIEVEE